MMRQPEVHSRAELAKGVALRDCSQDAIADLPPGVWSGPVTSPFGRHLVRVTERREASLPPLEAVRDRVERDWRASFAETLREDRFEALRSRYQVVRPDTAMVLGQ